MKDEKKELTPNQAGCLGGGFMSKFRENLVYKPTDSLLLKTVRVIVLFLILLIGVATLFVTASTPANMFIAIVLTVEIVVWVATVVAIGVKLKILR